MAKHAVEFMEHFRKRSRQEGKWIREDKWWEAHLGKPWYFEQEDAANKWDRGNVPRLANMVVALNRVFDAVRKCLRETYRLRDGQLGVHDEMGVRNDGEGAIHYWHDFVKVKAAE